MKTSLNLSLVGAVAALSSGRVEAVDFEFRNFEGLWESVSREARFPPVNRVTSDPTSFKCYATGNFLKAVCETTTVLTGDETCFNVFGPRQPNALLTNKFSLDQFDAETGIAKDLEADLQCCGTDNVGVNRCSVYPWSFIQYLAGQDPDAYPGVPPLANPAEPATIGPEVIATIEQQPGKSNRHIKSIKATIRPKGVDVDTYEPDVDFLYKVGGGFKSLD